MTEKILIQETDNYKELLQFFIDNELEYESGEIAPDDLIKCYSARGEDGRLLGGCVLALREGRYICDGIATDPSIRGRNIGKRLLKKIVDEAHKRGADALYLVARAPDFYRKNGFVAIPREEAPSFFECFTCSQYLTSCQPEVMKLALGE